MPRNYVTSTAGRGQAGPSLVGTSGLFSVNNKQSGCQQLASPVAGLVQSGGSAAGTAGDTPESGAHSVLLTSQQHQLMEGVGGGGGVTSVYSFISLPAMRLVSRAGAFQPITPVTQ